MRTNRQAGGWMSLLRSEGGFTLFTLLIAISLMMILLTVAEERWSSVLRREREEELIFRGQQVVTAIQLYRKKFPGAFPPSLKVLVDQKFLRQLYKDPMTVDGVWNLVLLSPGAEKKFVLLPDTEKKETAGQALRIAGVASQSTDKAARIYNDADTYDKWLFTVMDEEKRGGRERGPKPRGGEREQVSPGEVPDEESGGVEGEEPEEPEPPDDQEGGSGDEPE